jgi:hypothetical protein
MFRLSAPARSHTEMKLRRIRWADGQTSIDPQDYEVIDERDQRIGRIYRAEAVGGGHVWRWFVYILAVDNVPPAGVAPSREEAMAAFKAAWASSEPRL